MRRLLPLLGALWLPAAACGGLEHPETQETLGVVEATVDPSPELDAALPSRVGLFWVRDNVYRTPLADPPAGASEGLEIVAWDLPVSAGFPAGFEVALDRLPPVELLTTRDDLLTELQDGWPEEAAVALGVLALYADHNGNGLPDLASSDPEAPLDEILRADSKTFVLWVEGAVPQLDVANGDVALGYQLARGDAGTVRILPDDPHVAAGPISVRDFSQALELRVPDEPSLEALVCLAPSRRLVSGEAPWAHDFTTPDAHVLCGAGGDDFVYEVHPCRHEKISAEAGSAVPDGWPCWSEERCQQEGATNTCDTAALADDIEAALAFAVVAGGVYWSVAGDPAIQGVRLVDGEPIEPIGGKNPKPPRHMVAHGDDTLVFATSSAIGQVQVPDGTPSVLGQTDADICDIAMHGDQLVWLDTKRVGFKALDGSDVGIVTLHQLPPAACDQLMVSDGKVYLWDPLEGALFSVDIAEGAEPEVVLTHQAEGSPIAVREGWLYWRQTRDNGGAISRIPLDGGGDPVDLITGQAPGTVLVEDDGLLWGDQLGGTLSRANLDGTEPLVIHRDDYFGNYPLAGDGDWIVWLRPDDGVLMRARRP